MRVNVNLAIEPHLYEEFCKYTEPMGIKVSPWVAGKMREFIEEQKELEKKKKGRS